MNDAVQRPVFDIQGVTKIYQMGEVQVQALRGVDLQIAASHFTVLLGPSGSGKSTILRAIVGLLPPCNGEIQLEGSENLGCLASDRSLDCKKDIQMIFQNPDSSLNPRKTVAEIISAPLELYFKMDPGAARAKAAELLKAVRRP